jgi:hypothetical protein
VAHVFFEESPVDGGEGFHGDKEVGSRGEPLVTVFGKTATRNDIMDVRVVLELSAPGVQDTGATWAVCPDEALVCGQPLESHGRRLKHGVVCEALMRAEKWAQGLRDGEGQEKVGAWELFLQVVV